MGKEMAAYCGLYCGHCYSRTHVAPTAKLLKDYMARQGFESFGHYMPNYKEFWEFLTMIIDGEGCLGCRQGGGSPGCAIRRCAQERMLDACPLCGDYPCEKFAWLGDRDKYPMLEKDNLTMKECGLDAWLAMQQERRRAGYTYVQEKLKRNEKRGGCG